MQFVTNTYVREFNHLKRKNYNKKHRQDSKTLYFKTHFSLLGNYGIFETNEFSRKLEVLTPPDSKFIRKKLQDYVYPQLRKEPVFGKNIRKLRGYTPETWRYRIDKFRIFYSVDD